MLKPVLARAGLSLSGASFQLLKRSLVVGATGRGSPLGSPSSTLSLLGLYKPGNYSIIGRGFGSNLKTSEAKFNGDSDSSFKMAAQTSSSTSGGGKSLEMVESALNNWLKPQLLGESWDNIGLLVGSGKYEKDEKVIEGIMLCNDLTPVVLDEAIAKKADMIVAYHPPIFSGLKSISYGNWKERLIARCLANDISVYSPHTTLDSTIGGINDRVLNVFRDGPNAECKPKAIIPSTFLDPDIRSICFVASVKDISNIMEKIRSQNFSDVITSVQVAATATLTVFGKGSVDKIAKMVADMELSKVVQAENVVDPTFGAGRIIELNEALDLDDAVDLLKSHLGLGYVQLAYGGNPKIKSAAVCVGSGSSLLKPIAGKIDLLITGEMSHHDILHCVHHKSSVVLCNHCSSERHYLPDLANILKVVTGLTNIFVSEEDACPLRLVL